MRLTTLILSATLLASLAAIAYGITGLTEVGTCADGGPYVSTRPCPDGTGAKIALVSGGLIVFVLGSITASFRSFSAGAFWFGALFTVLGTTFIVAEATNKAAESGGGVGWFLGGLFLFMGVLPMLGGIKGLLDERHDDTPPTAFTGPYIVGADLRQPPRA